jgi:hypothetical protein
MKKFLLFASLAAGLTLLSPAMAQGTRTNQNLEPTCTNTGGGMDPRCAGDVTPNTEGGSMRNARPARETRPIQTAAPRRAAINCK